MCNMGYWIAVILLGVSALVTCAMSLPILKIFQLGGYKAGGIFGWWKSTGYNSLIRYVGFTLFAFIAMIVFVGCFGTFDYIPYCASALYLILGAVFIYASYKNGDTDIKPTGRMKRLISASMILYLILAAGACWATYASVYCQTLIAALGVFVPFVVIAANVIMTPIEKLIRSKYVKSAKRKLEEKRPTVIGITGSYGKTTAKNLLAAMLPGALATPASYNTPMGVCMSINNDLADQKIFIAEMGARYKGDIAELCRIVSPDIGLITAVGDMHLSTFKTHENVANAKFELAESLPKEGLAVINGYNEGASKLAERDMACRSEVVGEGNRISYSDLKLTAAGTEFTLSVDGETRRVTTRLLGAHIAELVCCCAAVALECGASLDGIVAAVESVAPVEHRLQLVPSAGNGVTVIDDAYNSNPVGAKNALEVLKLFDGKRIIITPGFVELGAIEKDCNIELGRDIADAADEAFLVGSRANDIKTGAMQSGMNEADISIFSSRDEAVAALKDISGDKVVLFENDLPDNIK